MKTFRFTLLLATGAAALGAALLQLQAADPAAAETADRPATKMKARGERLRHAADRLGLTDDQRTQLKSIREKARRDVEAVRQDANLDQAQKREKMRAAVQASRAEADKVFTPEQREKVQAGRERTADRIRHGVRARIHERMAGWHARQSGPGWGPGSMQPHGWNPRRGARHPQGPDMLPGGRPPGPPPGFGFGPGDAGRRWAPGAGAWNRGPQAHGQFAGPGFGAKLKLTDEQKAKAQELRARQREKLDELLRSGRDEFRALLTPEQQKEFDARAPKPPAGK